MRKSIVFLSFIVYLLLLTPYANAATDNPHDPSNTISCSSCHFAYGSAPTWYQQEPDPANPDTKYPLNRLCWSCHGSSAPYKMTHSDFTINGVEGWTCECRTCHNPHYQRQNRRWGSASYLYSGASTAVAANTITKTGAGWTPDYWIGKVVIANVTYPNFNYRIVSNTADTLTVQGTINIGYYVKAGNTFAIVYRKLVKDYINAKNVKFFRPTGKNSFADGDTTYDGICEVCHTQTAHFRNNGSLPPDQQNHANIGGGIPGTNCTTCHPHIEGFKPTCNACHGYPPLPLASIPLPTGSLTAGEHVFHATTKGYDCSICHYNSAGEGITHNNHIITLGFVNLLGAYTGGSYDGQTSANYQSSDTGTTVSKTGLKKCSNLYCHGGTMAPDGGAASAIWDNPSSAACGTCHGASTASPPIRGSHSKHAGSTMQLPCSDCHKGYTPTTIPSGMNTHVNNQANFAFDTTKNYIGGSASYNGTITMLDAYGQCSTTYCHGSSTPTWGGASIACNGCHDASKTGLSTRHDRHYNTATVPSTLLDPNAHTASEYVYGCSNCHPTTSHAQGPVSTVQDAEINGTEIPSANYTPALTNLTDAKGFKYTNYGTCITVCHTRDGGSGAPIVTAKWGDAYTGTCGVCHNKAGDASPVWSTPHTRHINTYSINTNFTCNACHSGTATNNTTINGAAGRNQHPNGVKDVSFNSFAGGTWTGTQCQNTYCHSKGTGGTLNPGETRGIFANTATTWGGSTTCGSCHGNESGNDGTGLPWYANGLPKTNTHVEHGCSTCKRCHYPTTTTGNTITDYTKHLNKLYDIGGDPGVGTITYTYYSDGGTCSVTLCHGATTVKWGGPHIDMSDCKSCHNSTKGSRRQIVASGGAGGDFIMGSGHVPPTVTPGAPGGATTIVYSPSANYVGAYPPGWTNPANAYSSDNVYASAGDNLSTVYYNYRDASNNPITIPSGATITKVEIGYEAYNAVFGGLVFVRASGNGGSTWLGGWYVDGSSTYTPPSGCGWGNLPTTQGSETVRYFACGTDRATSPWSFTAANLSDANFRVEIRSRYQTISLDWLPVRVTYSAPPSPPTVTENVTNADCIVCHDQSQHMCGVVRLKDADTGTAYNYDPANPSTAEAFCLNCHDTNGKNGNMKPFSDLKELGVIPYKMSKDIKTHWTKTYGHQTLAAGMKLTCLGAGTSGTGCHGSGSAINGHGSVNKGLLAKNLTLPNTNAGPYVTANGPDYEICFSCHAGYTGFRKEDILGVKSGGGYDNDHGWTGYLPPYYIPNILTKFRDRNNTPYGTPFYNDHGYGFRDNLHWFHIQDSGWRYRDSISSKTNCLTCHNVHGSNTQYGWVYDEFLYNHYAGTGSDQYGMMSITPLSNLGNYPISCTTNCHTMYGPLHNWFEPSGE